MKPKDTLSLELDGKISLVTRKGKKVTREPMNGKMCLEVLLAAIMEGIERLQDE
jgi:hypothetical protein